MPTETDSEIKLLSPEVHEIISQQPGWVLRNGITLFAIIIVGLVAITFFIRYPDIVNGRAIFTSVNAPKEIKLKTDGKLVKLFVKESDSVLKGQVLGFIESRADHDEVMTLTGELDTLQDYLQENKEALLKGYFSQPYKNLGEIQQPFQVFMQSYILYNQYLSAGYYLKKKGMLQHDIDFLKKLHANLMQQQAMQKEDVGLAKETFDANKSLKEDKVISALDYRNERSKLISKELIIPQASAAIINNESSQHEKQKEIFQLENDIAQQKAIFSEALNTLRAQLSDWINKYVLIAPIDGKISFAGFFQENQQLSNNQVLCFINPGNTQYFAEVYIPQSNFGKIKEGQKVYLKLPAYNFQEFGSVMGRLDFISNTASDSGYLAKVSLPEGLHTNYNKTLQYHEGLSAQAEIVTTDLKLSDRLFNQFKSLINRR